MAVTEVTFLTKHNNLNWPNTSTHVVSPNLA